MPSECRSHLKGSRKICGIILEEGWPLGLVHKNDWSHGRLRFGISDYLDVKQCTLQITYLTWTCKYLFWKPAISWAKTWGALRENHRPWPYAPAFENSFLQRRTSLITFSTSVDDMQEQVKHQPLYFKRVSLWIFYRKYWKNGSCFSRIKCRRL